VTGDTRRAEARNLVGRNFGDRFTDEVGDFGPAATQGKGDVVLAPTTGESYGFRGVAAFIVKKFSILI
jgi:hypothetical protein